MSGPELSARQKIGRRIAEIRKANSLTQTDVATVAGIRQQHVARVEAGAYSAGIDLIAKIAGALNCEIELIPK